MRSSNDNAAVQVNGGQNQTGLSHNASGAGSLQWTDLGGGWVRRSPGGTARRGTAIRFNNRTTDLSNYEKMIVRMPATDAIVAEAILGVQGFFQKNNFSFRRGIGTCD